MRWQPRGRAVRRESNLQISGKVVHPGVEGRIKLHEVRVDTPLLLLLDSCVYVVHSPYVANKSREVGEGSSNMEFRVITTWHWPRYTQIQRFHLNCEIGTAFFMSDIELVIGGFDRPCGEPIISSQTKIVCQTRVFVIQSAISDPHGLPALCSS